MKVIDNLYSDYKEKCLQRDQNYISKKNFEVIHKKARKYVLDVYEKNKKVGKPGQIPTCVMKIDDNWLYWVEIRDRHGEEVAVVNFITNDQYEYLLKGSEHEKRTS